MALTKIEYGSIASSGTLNNNFDYLDDRISDLALLVATLQSNMSSIGVNANAQLEAKAAQITADMETLRSELKDEITNIDNTVGKALGENGMYVTTYAAGNNWYREYFSDSAKTKRVWLEQGGKATGGNDGSAKVTLMKAYSNTNYNIQITSVDSVSRDLGRYNYSAEAGSTSSKTVSGFTIDWVWGGRYWYTCGK